MTKPRTKKRKSSGCGRILLWLFVIIPALALGLLALANWVIMPMIARHGTEMPVPNTVGMARSQAESTITDAGLQVGTIRTVSDTAYPPEHVVFQYPPAGRKVKPGRLVHLDVSRGANRVSVPDVVGMSFTLARALLEEAGLMVAEVESLRTPNLPVDQVIAVRPASGTDVARGTPLTLAVSAAVGRFPMPNVLGMNLETASGIIASQGLVVGRVKQAPSDEPSGLVLVQYPEEGMPVADRDSVHLIVAVPVAQPDSQP
jgi:beta-lactam-binding protein with PASTA domain